MNKKCLKMSSAAVLIGILRVRSHWSGKLKVKKNCLWKQNTQNRKNQRLGLIEFLHMQLVVCEAAYAPMYWLKSYSIFKITRMGSLIPKEIKYNLHYVIGITNLQQQKGEIRCCFLFLMNIFSAKVTFFFSY